jgi:hypothetical protein
MHRKKLLGIIIVAFTSLVGIGVYLGHSYYKHRGTVRQLPGSIRERLDFPILLPRDTTLHNISASVYSQNTLTLNIKTGTGSSILITQQKRPDDFQLERYLTNRDLTGARFFETRHGKVLVGTLAQKKVFFLLSEKTLVTGTALVLADNAIDELLNNLVALDY